MPQNPQISLLLRAIERDLAEAVERAEDPSEPPATARIAHLMAAADLALVTAQMASKLVSASALVLVAYELGRALGPRQER